METLEARDFTPVRSRISWSAVFAGAVIALALYLLLSALGVALGLSVNRSLDEQGMGTAAGIWAVVTTLVALFVGGLVATQCTAGETRGEGVVYGALVWGVVFGALVWLMASGMAMGFNAVMNAATSPAAAAAVRASDADLQAAGFTDEQINSMRQQFDALRNRQSNVANDVRAVARDPRTTAAAWWTFAGILLSMVACIAGALFGAGPNVAIAGLRVRTVQIERHPGTTETTQRHEVVSR